jgi:hypothetical protein
MKKLLVILLLISTYTQAQIPTRLISNPGFEQPSMGCTNCYNLYSQSSVNGWSTTDPTGMIELWGTTFLGRNSHSGTQFAEINANNSSFLYQELCLAPNEVINYSIWYLQRGSCGVTEQMRAQLTTNTNVVIAQSPTYAATTSWVNYTGTLTNNATGGIRRIGFVSISAGACGNLIDDITISLKPIISLYSFTPTSHNEGLGTKLNVMVNGRLLSSATVNILLSGTATCLSDYTVGTPTRGTISNITTNGITLNLPAGDYDPNLSTGASAGLISIPISTSVDGIAEPSETIICSIEQIAGGGNGNPSLDLTNIINGNGALCNSYISSISDTIKNVSPLPIELTEFKAKATPNSVKIVWSTETETDNDYFILLHSLNGYEYDYLATIKGAGTTNIPKRYSFIDTNPYIGVNYYILTQIDYNGEKETYPPISSYFLRPKSEQYIWHYYNFLGQKIK